MNKFSQRRLRRFVALLTIQIAYAASGATVSHAAEPLPSWNDGPTRQAILQFVQTVTTPESPAFVPPAERIATFDNDGTLWSEQPIYFQLRFAIDRVRELAPQHPEWQSQQPFKDVLADNPETLASIDQAGLGKLVMASHANMTTDQFTQSVKAWLESARHPRFDRPYTQLVYQPMLELLDYLRANGFKTFIVSGGGIDFLRAFAENVYGIPPEQVIGSIIKTEYDETGAEPVIQRFPQFDFVNDKQGKPIAINRVIGRRPIAAFGNSDGDLQMLQWTAAGKGPRLCLLVRHTDDTREWAYDRDSKIGRLDAALDEATARDWTVVDMQQDWKSVYPPKN